METEVLITDWVRNHKVCWELAPLHELNESHVRVAVGFELTLYARHEPGGRPDPGCPMCLSLHEGLKTIARSVLPEMHRPTRFEIEPFDRAFHLRPESEWMPEVELTVRISHREDYFRGIDECEKRCADEIRGKLEKLGVRHEAWKESRHVAGPYC